MDEKVVSIIQARMGSTRLPGKVMADIEGAPLLEHVIRRVQTAELVDQVVVATTGLPEDNIVAQTAKDLGVEAYRGSVDDVLKRMTEAAFKFEADVIVRITADDPFKDPEIIDKTIQIMLDRDDLEYTSTYKYPLGMDVECIRWEALAEADDETRSPYDREHVTPFIKTQGILYRSDFLYNDKNLSHLRWTIDTPEDLEYAREVYRKLAPNTLFGMQDILGLSS